LRIVLSNIGTFGDINPLIAMALELKRRGHAPVMAVPAVFEEKIVPLGLEFHAVRPDIDPENTILVEMIYDVKKGTERGLREFLFPVLRQTYDDLLDAATRPERADLLLLGELNYAGPLVAEVTGIPWASYVLARSFRRSTRRFCPCIRGWRGRTRQFRGWAGRSGGWRGL
jgi:rhamnosyltransferase subunit B